MKLGLIGLPQSGKKTLFELLTGTAIPENQREQNKPLPGFALIRDQRFKALVDMYGPKKEAPAKIDIILLPKIEKNAASDNELFRHIADADAVCHVVRAFTDGSVYHIDGSVNPKRDIDAVNSELLLHDLIFAEKRIERIVKESKKQNDAKIKAEEGLMKRFIEHLEMEKPLRTMELNEEEKKLIRGYPLLTLKELFIVLNVDDSAISGNSQAESISEAYRDLRIRCMQVSAKMEWEIALLENEEERKEFMNDAGIKESALAALSRLAMTSLGLMSFFTVGKDEVRQWLIRADSSAPVAAGAIHSDIQKGFIRAEVMKYQDLMDGGSEEAVKKAGKFHVMGKDYIVLDGDIISFRFNV